MGAVDDNDDLASFSSKGPVTWKDHIISKPDIVAPGVNICAAQHGDYASSSECIDNNHIEISGTSMATPHVAGTVALVQAASTDQLSPAEIESVLESTAVSLDAKRIRQGAGRIDTAAAVAEVATTESVSNEAISVAYNETTAVDADGVGYNETVTVVSHQSELSAGEDYDWDASNGEIRFFNTSSTRANESVNVSYAVRRVPTTTDRIANLIAVFEVPIALLITLMLGLGALWRIPN